MKPALKKPPQPFAMRCYLLTEPYREEIEKILNEVEEKKSTNGFNLKIRLQSALKLLDERDDLMNYARAMEQYARRLRRTVGKP